MLFRRAASLVNAVQLDGSEAALNAVLRDDQHGGGHAGGELELSTAHGRRIARRGNWIARDVATRCVRLYEDGLFQATHEAVMR